MPSGRSAPTTSVRTGSAAPSRDEIPEVDGAATGTVEWGPVRYDRLRSVTLGVAAVIAAAVVTALAALGLALVGGLTAGGAESASSIGASAIALGVLLVAATVISLVPVVAVARSEWSTESGSLREVIDLSSLRPRWILGGGVAAVGLFAAVPMDVGGALWPLASVLFVLPQLLRSGGTTVRVDPDEPTVERENHATDRTRRDDLRAVVRTRRLDLPGVETTLFLLAYRGNAWYRSTPWLIVPDELADAVESALDDALSRGDGPERATVPERVTLALLGSASLVVGVVIAVASGEGAAGLFLALLTAPLSLLFLALAARL
ncbi:hypothetical protein [Halorubrum salinum]|uniref:hypothetical protein n=1 Tax=Halorubrum salinum TaxID=767517 RepID=UPI00211134FF|nr:hypothetical protein [Halorubrum salinum]